MIIKLFAFFTAFCFISCFSQNNEKKVDYIDSFILEKDHYIYELKYVTNKNYPYKLWPFRIGGGYDGMHKEVARAPKGSILLIHRQKLKRDLYAPDSFVVNGTVEIQGQVYRIETTLSK